MYEFVYINLYIKKNLHVQINIYKFIYTNSYSFSYTNHYIKIHIQIDT
jgi:hypothetical protein